MICGFAYNKNAKNYQLSLWEQWRDWLGLQYSYNSRQLFQLMVQQPSDDSC